MLAFCVTRFVLASVFLAPPGLPRATPESVGFDAAQLTPIDTIVAEGIEDGNMAGCVVAIGRHGKIAMLRAYGDRQVEPTRLPMRTDTLFDLASLTKPIATATSIMTLIERMELDLASPVSRYIPEFGSNGKQEITVQQLLIHQSGLTPDNALSDYDHGSAEAFRRIHALRPRAEPGTRFMYSDVGFIVLAEIVRHLTDTDIHQYSRQQVFDPLGMSDTGYLPDEELRDRAAATERREGRWMRGEVHDPRAYRLGGVAGHAGLFSTAEDLARFAQMMLQEGQYEDVRIMKPATVQLMTQPVRVSGGWRALGWDVRTGYSSNRGDRLSDRAFGHGGFTGTAIWIDPELQMFIVFLSTRLHPDGKGTVNPLIGRICTQAASAIRKIETTTR